MVTAPTLTWGRLREARAPATPGKSPRPDLIPLWGDANFIAESAAEVVRVFEADLEGGVRHADAGLQEFAGLCDSLACNVAHRGQAGCALEVALASLS